MTCVCSADLLAALGYCQTAILASAGSFSIMWVDVERGGSLVNARADRSQEMPTGLRPGMAYEDMYELVYSAKPSVAKMFSNELLIAIFWEESLFNNIEQIGGTAWGFGQVEPREMYWLEQDQAKQYGYYVPGLPRRIILARDEKGRPTKVKLGGALTPEQSVQVAASILCHYYFTVSPDVERALEAYGGVGYKGKNVPAHLATDSDRRKIIRGWLACAAHLQRGSEPEIVVPLPKKQQQSTQPQSSDQEFPANVKAALKKARSFELNNKEFDDILFPKNYVSSTGEKIWRPQRTPGWLTDLAKRGWK